MKRPGKVRIAIDFESATAAVEFMRELRALELLPPDVGAYRIDALDRIAKHGGIAGRNTYIVRRVGDRPDEDRLTTTQEVEG